MGGQPNFALSWILTWFSHDIKQLRDVQLIFDSILAIHPLFGVYITVAQIILVRNQLIQHDDPAMAGFEVFKAIQEN